MTGKLLINGTDAYVKYGAFISQNGIKELFSFPALKEPAKNDWPEDNGLNVDLTAPVLDGRTLSIGFGSTKMFNYESFIRQFKIGGYTAFDIEGVGIRKLRYVSQGNLRLLGYSGLFTLTFADDFPMDGYIYAAPSGGQGHAHYKIDGKPLSYYGIYLQKGSENELRKAADAKTNLTNSLKTSAGITYDVDQFFDKERNLKLNCILIAPDQTTFWKNYHAFLYDLIQPGEREFDFLYRAFKFYYGKIDAVNVSILGGKIWCEFTLSMIATESKGNGVGYMGIEQDFTIQ